MNLIASPDRIKNDLATYDRFGIKAAGGRGDTASGDWLTRELHTHGYAVERPTFEVPFFVPRQVSLTAGEARAALIAQAVVVPTPEAGVSGPLVHVDLRLPLALPAGAIALVDLPERAWSSATSPELRELAWRCATAGVAGIVLVTNGPSGQAIALNAPAGVPLFTVPTACLAPQDAAPFLRAARDGQRAVLHVLGRGGRRPAFNVIGQRAGRGATRSIVVTTPRSGWFSCAAERGPGIAIWLELMRWASHADLPVDLVFSANSGHEYENLGAEHLVAGAFPAPADTALWLHLGASVVTSGVRGMRDGLLPRDHALAPRLCIATEHSLPWAKTAFSGWPGWSDPVFTTAFRTGEAGTAIAAGHDSVIGLIGDNPLHHVRGDTGMNVEARLIRAVATGCRRLLEARATGR